MKPLFKRLFALSLLLLSQSCGWQQLRFEARFTEEISPRQNLIFRFSEKIAALRDIGRWDTTQYVHIYPRVQGQFKWTAPDEVVFSPEKPFEMGTEFTATPAGILEKITGKEFGESEAFRFHTPYRKLEKTRHCWLTNDGRLQLSVSLVFNDKVEVEKLAKDINIQQKGKKLSFQTAEREKVEELSIKLTDLPELGAPIEISWVEGKNNSTRNKVELELTKPENLEVTDIETEGSEYGNDVVRVYFNQGIANETLTGNINIANQNALPSLSREHVVEFAGYFSRSEVYMIRTGPQLKGLAGGTLPQWLAYEFTFGERGGSIRFAETGSSLLSKEGNKNVAMLIQGVEEIDVAVFKIYDNNLNRFDNEYGYSEYSDYQEHGTKIYQTTMRVNALPMKGKFRLLNLDFINPNTYGFGAYLLKVNASNELYSGASKLITISDIGLVARKTSNSFWVWARSLKTGEPMPGVKIRLIARNNQVLAEGTTGSNGHTSFSNIDRYSEDFRSTVVLASTATDFNYLKVDYENLSGQRMETAGGWQGNQANLMAFVYGERNLYRPGETINFQMVLRHKNNWQSPGSIPIMVALTNAEGKEVNRSKLLTNEEGTASFSYNLPSNAGTGSYSFVVYTATEVYLESKQVSVEEFQPEKLVVQVNLQEKNARPGDEIHLKGKVKTYFGSVWANKPLEAYVSFSRVVDVPSENLDIDPRYPFSFNMNPEEQDFGFKIELQTKIDGSIDQTITIPADMAGKGRFKGEVQVTAFDESERPVTRSASFTVNTQPYLLGIRTKNSGASKDQPFYFELAALDHKNEPTQATAYVKVYRQEWVNSYERNVEGDEYERIVSRNKLSLVNKAKVQFKGQKVFTVYPKEPGSHVVRVYASENATHYVEESFYVNSYEVAGNWEADKAAGVKLELDKNTYNPGDKALLSIKTPFDGDVLLTWENDKVSEHRFVSAKNRMATLEFEVKSHWLPNVFINAVLLRKYNKQGDPTPLTVGHGLINLKVNPVNNILKLALQAPEKVNTTEKITVKLKTSPGAVVTLAAVDEAVLKMGNFNTPDPLGYFFQKRALAVESFDVFGQIFSEIKLPGASVAGGGEAAAMAAGLAKEEDLVGRQNPMADKLASIYAHWSGPLLSSATGEVSFSFPATGFNGRVRLMVVGVKGNKFGATEQMVQAVDPVVVNLGLPPFLAPGDEITCPLVLFNTENVEKEVNLSFTQLNKLSTDSKSALVIRLKPRSDYSTFVNLKAANEPGKAGVSFALKAGSFSAKPEATTFIRPAVSLYKTASQGTIARGSEKVLAFNEPFVNGTDTRYLLVSKFPTARLANAYGLLTDMDYGCLEQTISMAFPLLYAENLVKLMPSKDGIAAQTSKATAKLKIEDAIRKVEGKQLYTGSFLVWPYAQTTYPWLDVYATHFLAEAQKAGFAVNASVLKQAMKATKNWSSELGAKSRIANIPVSDNEPFEIQSNQTFVHSEVLPAARSYAQLVLALNGQANLPAMNADKARLNKLTAEGLALLGAAYAATGDQVSAKTVLSKALESNPKFRFHAEEFGSAIRLRAVSLLAQMEQNADPATLESLAETLMNELNGANWANSQDLGFGLLALGKWMKVSKTGEGNAEVFASGKLLGKIKEDFLAISKNLNNQRVTVKSTGKGPVYYSMYQSGLPLTPLVKNEDKGLEIRRTYFDRAGNAVNISDLKVNDLLVVKLTLKSKGAPRVDNVMITDMLPACVEAENKNLREETALPWAKPSTPDHSEIRIDRVQLFVTASSKPQDYYYQVRVTHAGRFQVGAVAAEALYQRSLYSFFGGGFWNVKPNNAPGS